MNGMYEELHTELMGKVRRFYDLVDLDLEVDFMPFADFFGEPIDVMERIEIEIEMLRCEIKAYIDHPERDSRDLHEVYVAPAQEKARKRLERKVSNKRFVFRTPENLARDYRKFKRSDGMTFDVYDAHIDQFIAEQLKTLSREHIADYGERRWKEPVDLARPETFTPLQASSYTEQ